MAAGSGDGERLAAARAEAEALRTRLEEARQERATLALGGLGKESKPTALELVRKLRGHFGKVCAVHWSKDPAKLVSAGLDGKLVIWNAMTENKLKGVSVKVAWLMSVSYEQSNPGKFVASGGLDNTCTIYDVSGPAAIVQTPLCELTGHDGYLSCSRFLDSGRILTASGDSTCAVWDIETRRAIKTYRRHGGDVMSVAVPVGEPSLFISGSVDQTAKIWDLRAGDDPVVTLVGHESDVNAVDFMRSGHAVATGSDDFTLRMYDLRAYAEVACFSAPEGGLDTPAGKVDVAGGVTSAAFSSSGRYLFAGYEDDKAIAWDTIAASPTVQVLKHSEDEAARISTVGVSADGNALCTGSWDNQLGIWA